MTRAGTLDYMSPEVLRCPGKVHPMDNKNRSDLWYSHSVDTWAVGVLAYELLNGCPPFSAPSRQQTEIQIMQLEPVLVADASPGAEDFIMACLTKNPEVRLMYGPACTRIETAASLLCSDSPCNHTYGYSCMPTAA